jgi:hypothetical protein
MPHQRPLPEQFWPKVERRGPEDCWPWIASRRPTGYGQLRRANRNLKAHRVSWELHRGPIPLGMVVMHTCDNPPCVNVAHLRLATQSANLADMRAKARGSGGRMPGSANPASKLTEEQVIALRSEAAAGASFRALGRSYGLNKKTVAQIVRREIWRSI